MDIGLHSHPLSLRDYAGKETVEETAQEAEPDPHDPSDDVQERNLEDSTL